MAEQTFRSPGFFEEEIDLSSRRATPLGTPAGVIGTSIKGPAFVPIEVGTFFDFSQRFGTLDPEKFGPYAVREFLKHKQSLTFLRVLGAGANETVTDISLTNTAGTVKNAGFKLESTLVRCNKPTDQRHQGAVQFITARHALRGHEAVGFPMFSDNDSTPLGGSKSSLVGNESRLSTETVNLVRGMLLLASGTRCGIVSGTLKETIGDATKVRRGSAGIIAGSGIMANRFGLYISSSAAGYGSAEGRVGVRIYTASLDPRDQYYISKVLNTDPKAFAEEEHLLYADFEVEAELATIATGKDASGFSTGLVSIVSGSAHDSTTSGVANQTMRDAYGRFDTRYTTPRTPSIISQPYGSTEHALFYFETISDGESDNSDFKISIANIRKSVDPKDEYGTFEVQVRRYEDNDLSPDVLERYSECSLNPFSENYIARKIGDKKAFYNFDATDDDERRLVIQGKYANRSARIRVIMDPRVDRALVPADALPFGFKGIPTIKTSDTLTDVSTSALKDRNGVAVGATTSNRLAHHNEVGTNNFPNNAAGKAVYWRMSQLTGSIVPPLPLRFKQTRGAVKEAATRLGEAGTNERVDNRLYWGIKFEKVPVTSSHANGSVSNAALNTNIGSQKNNLVAAYGKFVGISRLDNLVTGSGADLFNNNKFSLSRVALPNTSLAHITSSAKAHMLEASYIRNGDPDAVEYKIKDPIASDVSRLTLASLVHTSAVTFNRFTDHAKFTTMFYGGFDGLNMLDNDVAKLNHKATSVGAGGKAAASFAGGMGLKGTNDGTMMGKGKLNNAIASYRSAIKIMTDPMASRINVLAIPGIKDSFVTDFAADRVKDYGMAIYLMDIEEYDASQNLLFEDSKTRIDVQETTEQFEGRVVDNNYVATYFPDVFIEDPVNNRSVEVPASVAAIGALGFNDKVAFPWFAPAGFNRGALSPVQNVKIRLNSSDRDVLYDARINPIAVFPNSGFVIFGQKTLQMAKSALDRVNVRRMLLEVKRLIGGVANRLLFEQNDATTRAKFVSQVTPLLALVQAQAGIEQFRVICDDTNNTEADREANRLNGKIVVVPTRAVEFIAIDFIITNSGVSFE